VHYDQDHRRTWHTANIQIPDGKATPEAFDSVNKIAVLVREFIKA
jgi:hypothetical protein